MTQILDLQDIANHTSCCGEGKVPEKEVVVSLAISALLV